MFSYFCLRKLRKISILKVLILALLIPSSFVNADTIKIGLRAHLGVEKSMEQWRATADYLSEKIPEHKFIFIPFVGINELFQAAKQNQFDFVLTNPSSYVEMELGMGASAILTLRNKRQGKPYSKFGSVIFTRKGSGINEVKDIRGKKIIAVAKRAFGGWRVAKRELIKEGLSDEELDKNVNFSGGIQQDVVSIVSLGSADVGVVRTDMLERMDASGLIKMSDFKIINRKSSKNFPFARSTQLYPEWPFIKMSKASSALSKKVALALLTISSKHPAAKDGKYVGWTVPEDYQPVHNLMKDLKVGVYKDYNKSPTEHFFEEYLVHFLVSVFFLAILIFMMLYIFSTNRKLVLANKAQNQLMDELENRVAERTADLQKEKENAERANNAKTEFLSSMSHELRTPMNAVLGFSQLIEHDAETRQLAEIQDNANEILHAGRHLLSLISDVLDLSQIEEGKFRVDIVPISINELVSDVIRLLDTQAKEKQITILYNTKVNDEFKIMADERSVKQVLINLISNAIKYNRANGNVNISIENEKNTYCKVSVADDGDGISEDKLKAIFDPFQRVTNRTEIEGSGVGLAVTKSLIDIMNGEIKVESTPGKGSTFIVLFKLAN